MKNNNFCLFSHVARAISVLSILKLTYNLVYSTMLLEQFSSLLKKIFLSSAATRGHCPSKDITVLTVRNLLLYTCPRILFALVSKGYPVPFMSVCQQSNGQRAFTRWKRSVWVLVTLAREKRTKMRSLSSVGQN
jgi:hypothetical protein